MNNSLKSNRNIKVGDYVIITDNRSTTTSFKNPDSRSIPVGTLGQVILGSNFSENLIRVRPIRCPSRTSIDRDAILSVFRELFNWFRERCYIICFS